MLCFVLLMSVILASQDFENGEATGWTNGTGGALEGWAVETGDAPSGTYSLVATSGSTGNVYARFAPTGELKTAGEVNCTLKVRTHGDAASRMLAVGLKGSGEDIQNRLAYVRFQPGGNVEAKDGATWRTCATWQANTVYKLKFAVSLDDGTYDVELDDAPIAQGYAKPDATADGFLYFFANRYERNSPPAGSKARIDDIDFGEPVTEQPGIFYWQHSGLDIEGKKDRLWLVEYAVAIDGQDLNAGGAIVNKRTERVNGWEDKLLAAGVSQETITRLKEIEKVYSADLIGNLLDGLDPMVTHRLWARVADMAGNWSTWTVSDDLFKPDTIPPAPPGKVSYEE